MKIAESLVSLSSTHKKVEQHQRRETLLFWRKGQEIRELAGGESGSGLRQVVEEFQEQAATVSLSEASRLRQSVPVKAAVQDLEKNAHPHDTLNMRILRAVFEKLTGRKFSLRDPGEIAEAIHKAKASQNAEDDAAAGATDMEGWGLVYEQQERHYEQEKTTFSASGIIQTEDGREIDFTVQLQMSREFLSEHTLSLRAGDALKDPLVVTFDGTAAQVTRETFSFDIDADGSLNQIVFTGPGSGFLALDGNQDGMVNDGSELFGAVSGDGFAELAVHDLDTNGWIDANDPVYDRLRIWSRDPDGLEQLVALAQRDVGAIYLGRVSTPFALKDEANELQGQVRASGIFLREDGSAGIIQQLDLVA